MKENIRVLFPYSLRSIIDNLKIHDDDLQEIRLRIGCPLQLRYRNKAYCVDHNGCLIQDVEAAYYVSERELRETMELVAEYSMYAYEEELKHGYITVSGGHRVGVSGEARMVDGKVRCVKYLYFINIRICHQIQGCAEPVLPKIRIGYGIQSTLVLAPPGAGKTTLLRDLVRCLSTGDTDNPGMQISLVDERSEIAACYRGIPQNDVGIRTDVLDGCPKYIGIVQMLRAMSPQIIAVDEIGSEQDLQAIRYAITCGCAFLATMHAESFEGFACGEIGKSILSERLFSCYVVLAADHKLIQFYNQRGEIC